MTDFETSTLSRNSTVIFTELANEFVMMDVESGEYFQMEATAAKIWELLEKPTQFADLVNTLTEQFEVEKESCENDVVQFVEELRELNLIKVA